MSMTTIIFDFFTAMPTYRNWDTEFIKNPRFPFGVIKKAIMSGVQIVPSWIGVFHRDCYPMAECYSLGKEMTYFNTPSGNIVDKDTSPRNQYPYALFKPSIHPFEVF